MSCNGLYLLPFTDIDRTLSLCLRFVADIPNNSQAQSRLKSRRGEKDLTILNAGLRERSNKAQK